MIEKEWEGISFSWLFLCKMQYALGYWLANVSKEANKHRYIEGMPEGEKIQGYQYSNPDWNRMN